MPTEAQRAGCGGHQLEGATSPALVVAMALYAALYPRHAHRERHRHALAAGLGSYQPGCVGGVAWLDAHSKRSNNPKPESAPGFRPVLPGIPVNITGTISEF